jgi:LPS O-antigen subunit length determinant protein (WzzB/FepE family)
MNDIKETFTIRRLTQTLIILVGLISAVLGIYTFFFQERKFQVDYEILANTNVLDINADITKLDITYDGSSLKSNNQSLRILNLRIRNTGTESILKTYYDSKDPLSAFIEKGKVIEKPELVATSNDYIKKNLEIRFDSLGKLTFSDIILEPNEYFTIKLLILHKTNETPILHSAGKIAGVKDIPIVNLVQQNKAEKSFWEITFSGNIFSQLLRALSYTLVVILIIVIIAITTDSISDKKRKSRRVRLSKKFKEKREYDYNKMDDAIFARFESDGIENLRRYQNLLKDENRLNQKHNNWVNKLKRNVEEEIQENDITSRELMLNDKFFSHRSEWTLINELISDGYAIKDKDKLVINQPMKRCLNMFIDFLKDEKYFDPNESHFYGGSSTITTTDITNG